MKELSLVCRPMMTFGKLVYGIAGILAKYRPTTERQSQIIKLHDSNYYFSILNAALAQHMLVSVQLNFLHTKLFLLQCT